MVELRELIKAIPCVQYSMNIAGVAVTMDLHKMHCVLVEHVDGSYGIITEKDIIRKVVARCRDPLTIQAWEIMTRPLITADADTDIHDAIVLMRQANVRNLVVTAHDRILGIVKRSTILNSLKFDEEEYWTVTAHSQNRTKV